MQGVFLLPYVCMHKRAGAVTEISLERGEVLHTGMKSFKTNIPKQSNPVKLVSKSCQILSKQCYNCSVNVRTTKVCQRMG